MVPFITVIVFRQSPFLTLNTPPPEQFNAVARSLASSVVATLRDWVTIGHTVMPVVVLVPSRVHIYSKKDPGGLGMHHLVIGVRSAAVVVGGQPFCAIGVTYNLLLAIDSKMDR